MTINDDWDRFVAMMEDDQSWTYQGGDSFICKAYVYNAHWGYLENRENGRRTNIGDWRQWLEAGHEEVKSDGS